MFFWTMLFSSVFRRRSRAIMVVVSCLVGAATFFTLLSVCLLVPRQMTQELQSYGANLIVKSNGTGRTAKGIAPDLVEHTTSMITGHGESATWAGYRYETVRIHSASYQVAGMDVTRTRQLNKYWSLQGSWPRSKDQILVGTDVAKTLSVTVGNTLKISYRAPSGKDQGGKNQASSSLDAPEVSNSSNANEGKAFSIAGIVDTGGAEDSMIYMTLPALTFLTGSERGLDLLEYSTSAQGDSLDRVTASINEMTSMNVTAQKVAKISTANSSIIAMLTTLFWIISLVVLILTIVGVSTTMTSLVSQRRSEIGLRKALGADSKSIAREFFSESALYGLIGGVLGIGVGYAVSLSLTRAVFQRTIGFDLPLALVCLLASLLVAIVASALPVKRATQIDPAVVLRDE